MIECIMYSRLKDIQ